MSSPARNPDNVPVKVGLASPYIRFVLFAVTTSTGPATIWKLLVMLNEVEFTATGLMSVTLIRTVFVLSACAWLGVQEINPLGATVSPDGPDTSAKLTELVGMSVSVAVAVALHVTIDIMLVMTGNVSVGALFISLTTTVKLLVA